MRRIILILLLGVFSLYAWAQQAITVKGTVRDKENKPVIGATVAVKGSSEGTKTDIDGNFTISILQGKILQFSYVGMQKSELTVSDASFLQVTLEEDNQLDEVVVVGYGTVKRRDLTGAVASVTGKDLQADVAKSASGALQGRIAGVTVSNTGGQPGSGMSINVRGLSSLGANTPLYVIDGVYGDINMVDPADIASLEVLKDASAAAIYGSRAANGVVLITTKSGKKEMAPTINVNFYSGVQNITKNWACWMRNSGKR